MIGSHVFHNACLPCRQAILLVSLYCDILLSHLFFESCTKIVQFDFANTLPVLVGNTNLTLENRIQFRRFVAIMIKK